MALDPVASPYRSAAPLLRPPRAWLAATLLAWSTAFAPAPTLADPPPAHRLPGIEQWQASPAALIEKVRKDRDKIEEFRFIAEKAKELGIADAWFSGGGAASFAHYEKQKILAEQGKLPLEPGRFIDDLLQVQRLSQDLDVVIDGSPEQCKQLQAALDARFPYRSGDKSKWEVRPLRQQMGMKVALLDSPDFLAQNNDSHSVGMVSLYSSKPDTERVFRDLRAWQSPEPPFLKDVAEHRLKFYPSLLHDQNSAAARDENPPLLSAIRYLIKAFQFNLDINDDDFQAIRKILSGLTPADVMSQKPYVQNWLRHNLRKLATQNGDLARSWNILDELGLRKKLIQLEDAGFFEAKADHKFNRRIFSREPLRPSQDPNAKPLSHADLGQIDQQLHLKKGSRPYVGMTAAQIGLKDLFHATKSIDAYESMTKAVGPSPNAFISRPGIEDAWYGPGFYAGVLSEANDQMVNKYWGDLVVRLEISPEAIEGKDFVYIRGGDTVKQQVVILNRDKVRVVHEASREKKFYSQLRSKAEASAQPMVSPGDTHHIGQDLSSGNQLWESYLDVVYYSKKIMSPAQRESLEAKGIWMGDGKEPSFDTAHEMLDKLGSSVAAITEETLVGHSQAAKAKQAFAQAQAKFLQAHGQLSASHPKSGSALPEELLDKLRPYWQSYQALVSLACATLEPIKQWDLLDSGVKLELNPKSAEDLRRAVEHGRENASAILKGIESSTYNKELFVEQTHSDPQTLLATARSHLARIKNLQPHLQASLDLPASAWDSSLAALKKSGPPPEAEGPVTEFLESIQSAIQVLWVNSYPSLSGPDSRLRSAWISHLKLVLNAAKALGSAKLQELRYEGKLRLVLDPSRFHEAEVLTLARDNEQALLEALSSHKHPFGPMGMADALGKIEPLTGKLPGFAESHKTEIASHGISPLRFAKLNSKAPRALLTFWQGFAEHAALAQKALPADAWASLIAAHPIVALPDPQGFHTAGAAQRALDAAKAIEEALGAQGAEAAKALKMSKEFRHFHSSWAISFMDKARAGSLAPLFVGQTAAVDCLSSVADQLAGANP